MPRTTTSSTSPRILGDTAGSAAPAWIARSASSTPGSNPDARTHPADQRTGERRERIVCRKCGETLSDAAAVFAMTAAGVAQAFLNPHGFVHEVVTVRRAENVVLTGPSTTDFTWYAGYAWRIAWCVKCAAHVGWSFAAVGEGEPRGFWALRRDAIVEEGH